MEWPAVNPIRRQTVEDIPWLKGFNASIKSFIASGSDPVGRQSIRMYNSKIINNGESIQRNGGSATFGSVHTPKSLRYSCPAEQVMNVLVRSGPIQNRNQKF